MKSTPASETSVSDAPLLKETRQGIIRRNPISLSFLVNSKQLGKAWSGTFP